MTKVIPIGHAQGKPGAVCKAPEISLPWPKNRARMHFGQSEANAKTIERLWARADLDDGTRLGLVLVAHWVSLTDIGRRGERREFPKEIGFGGVWDSGFLKSFTVACRWLDTLQKTCNAKDARDGGI